MAMSESLRARIAALRIDYVKSFVQEEADFRSELAAYQDDGDQGAISRRAHRIAGTSGSYQLDEVCAAAQKVETLCETGGSEADIDAAVQVLCTQLLRAAT